MDTFWQVFLGAFGGGAVLVTLLAFLGKALFQQLLAKDLETFKAELARERERHGVVFSRLHAERASAIAEIYEHVASLNAELTIVTESVKRGGQLDVKEAVQHLMALWGTFKKRRIWLSHSLALRLDTFVQTARSSISNALLYAGEGMEETQTRLDTLLASLEAEFREVLGADAA